MVEVTRRLLRLRWCRSGGCGGAVVMLMAAAVGDEGDGDEGGVACHRLMLLVVWWVGCWPEFGGRKTWPKIKGRRWCEGGR
ncbi:hypothetical protein Tco_1492769 [Tanacetum coccineum]